MKKSKLSILLLFLVMILAISAVSAADTNDTSDSAVQAVDEAPVDEVASSDVDAVAATDDAGVLSTGGQNFTQLKDKIDNPEYGVMVNLQSNYTRVSNEETIVIDDDLFIDGHGYTIDANNAGGIFEIKEDHAVILDNIVFINANVEKGGAIFNGGKVVIQNCLFINNYATYGGAIYNTADGNVEIKYGSTFEENTATKGGAIYSLGAVKIDDSYFNDNTAENGGAVYAEADINLNITHTEFNENTATNRGGAIWSTGTLNIKDSSFDKNDITNRVDNVDNGGAAIFSNGTLDVDNSAFTNNLLGYVVRTGDNNNPQLIDGVVLSSGVAVINNSYFENNRGTYGAAITSVPIKSLGSTFASLTVENSEFVNNLAYNGAGINVNADGSGHTTYLINNCTFIGNNATGIGSPGTPSSGGAVFLARDTEGTVANSRFYNNTATLGGAISISAAKNSLKATVDNCVFENNTAVGSVDSEAIGGAIRIGGLASSDNMVATIENSEFTNNAAADGGSAIYNAGTLELSNNTADAGSDIKSVGTITSPVIAVVTADKTTYRIEQVTLTARLTDDMGNVINDTTFKFVFNTPAGLAAIPATLGDNGNYTVKFTPTKDGEYNVTADYAGVINATFTVYRTLTDLAEAIDGKSQVTLDGDYTYNADYDTGLLPTGIVINHNIIINGNGSVINANGASIHIFTIASGYTVTLANVTITGVNMSAGEKKGAVINNGDLTVDNCIFINNQVNRRNGDDVGVAINNHGTSLTVIGSKFINNTSPHNFEATSGKTIENSVGAIHSLASNGVSIKDSYFEGNIGRWGAAITFEQLNQATAAVENCTFYKNIAYQGGAINVNDGCKHVVVTNCTFDSNSYIGPNGDATHGANGGAISVGCGATLELSDSVFVNNKGDGSYISSGAAISFSDNAGGSITNCTFENNVDLNGASDIDVGDVNGAPASVTIKDSRFINSDAKGKAPVYINKGVTGTVDNCTFEGNNKYDIYNSGDITLNKNTLPNGVFSNGTITSQVKVTTYDAVVHYGGKVILTAKITDDVGNLMDCTEFYFQVNATVDKYGPAVYNPNTGKYEFEQEFSLPLGTYEITMYREGKDLTYVEKGNLTAVPKKSTYSDLQAQIDALAPGATLELTYDFAYDAAYDGAKFPNGVLISKDLTINGNGCTICGNDSVRIFNVANGVDLTLNNLTLCHGKADMGGAIFIKYDSNLTINDVTFEKNTATMFGGAIYDDGSRVNITISNSEFINNTAAWGAGAINAVKQGSSLTIDHTDFKFNKAYDAGEGGAIMVQDLNSFKLDYCNFINNTASDASGAISITKSGASEFEAIITNSNFINNTAAGHAGAVLIWENPVTIENSKFINNTAAGNGGALNIRKATVDIKESDFINNTAAAGEAIYVRANANASIEGSTFSGNGETTDYSIYSLGTLSLSGNTIDNVVYSSGTINTTYTAFVLANQTIYTNESSYILNATLTNEMGNKIYDPNLRFTVNGEQIADQPAYSNGVYTVTYGRFTTDNPSYLISVNTTDLDTLIIKTGVVVNILRGTFTDLQQRIEAANGNPVVLDCNFTYNAEFDSAIKTAGGIAIGSDVTINGKGYTICGNDSVRIFNVANGVDLTLNNLTLCHGKADMGGAIFIKYDSNLTINDVTFEKNTATMFGGAIYDDGSRVNITISNSEFINNTAAWGAGAINAVKQGSSLTIDHTDFKFNKAYDAGEGGAIMVQDLNSFKLDYCNFINNTASDASGAISITKSGASEFEAIITNSNFINNTAAGHAGAVLIWENPVTIENSKFINNTAAGNGGALNIRKATVDIKESDFINNTAAAGEAIYVRANANASIEGSTFSGNGETTDYSIYNLGTLKLLGGNSIDNLIYSKGALDSIVNATLIGGKEIPAALGEVVYPNATLTDRDGNAIYDPEFKISVGGVELNTTYDDVNKLYTASYTIATAGNKTVSTNYATTNKTEGKYIVDMANVTSFMIDILDIVQGENATVEIALVGVNDEGLNATVTVYINNKPITITVQDGYGSQNVSGLDAGQYPVFAQFNDVDGNYNTAYNSTVFYVKSTQAVLDVEIEDTVVYGETFTIYVDELSDMDGNPLNGIVVVDIAGNTYNIAVVNGTGSLEVTGIILNVTDDGYDWTATFENELYNTTSETGTLTVIPKSVYLDVRTNDGVAVGEEGQIKVIFYDDDNVYAGEEVELIFTNETGDIVAVCKILTSDEVHGPEGSDILEFTKYWKIGMYYVSVKSQNFIFKQPSEDEDDEDEAPAYYQFTSYAVDGTEWGTGVAVVIDDPLLGYIPVKVVSNSFSDEFVDEVFYIEDYAVADGESLYELFDANAVGTGIYVKVSPAFEYPVHKKAIDAVVIEGDGEYVYGGEHIVVIELGEYGDYYEFTSYGDEACTIEYGTGIVEVDDRVGKYISVKVLSNDFDDRFVGQTFYVLDDEYGEDEPVQLHMMNDNDEIVPVDLWVKVSELRGYYKLINITCPATVEVDRLDDDVDEYIKTIETSFEYGRLSIDLSGLETGDYILKVEIDDATYELHSHDYDRDIEYPYALLYTDDYLFRVVEDHVYVNNVNGTDWTQYGDERIFNFELWHHYWIDDDEVDELFVYNTTAGVIIYKVVRDEHDVILSIDEIDSYVVNITDGISGSINLTYLGAGEYKVTVMLNDTNYTIEGWDEDAPIVYEYTSYNEDGTVEYGSGTVEVIGEAKDGFIPVVVILNLPDSSFDGQLFYIKDDADEKGKFLNQLYRMDDNNDIVPVDIWVTVSKFSDKDTPYYAEHFNVDKANVEVNVTVVGQITYGENETVTVTVVTPTGEKLNETVEINIMGKESFNITLANGTVTFNLTGYDVGTYTIWVNFFGTDNFWDSYNNINGFSVDKATPQVSVRAVETHYGYDADISVDVIGVYGEYVEGTVIVTVEGIDYVVKDGKITVPAGLASGVYNITARFIGNDNYNEATNDTAKLNITASEVTIVTISVTNVTYGIEPTVTITLKDGEGKNISGLVDVSIGGLTGINKVNVDGVANYTLGVMNVGSYNITASIDGVSDIAFFTVDKANNATINVVPNEPTYGEAANITVSAFDGTAPIAGKAYVTVDGTPLEGGYPIDGATVIGLGNLTGGVHTIEVEFVSDNYATVIEFTSVTVGKAAPEIAITDIAGSVGDTVEANVTIAGGDATGLIFFNGEVYIVKDGKATIPVKLLTAGMQTITVIYTGDDNYRNGTANKEFKVVSPTSISTDIVNGSSVDACEDMTVEVTVDPAVNGTYSLWIDGLVPDYGPLTVQDGKGSLIILSGDLTAGKHNITVQFVGDEFYMASEKVTYVFTAVKKDSIITITTGDVVVDEPLDVTITIGNLTGDVTVDGDVYQGTVTLTNGKGTFTIAKENMTFGQKSIRVRVSNNDKYADNSTSYDFEVEKAENYTFELNITVPEINAGENLTFNVTLPEDANGIVNVTVDGESAALANVINGNATVEIPAEAFTAGRNNTIEVIFEPAGDKYNRTSVETEIYVSKLDYDLTATAQNIELGQNVTIVVNLPEGADGRIYAELQGSMYPGADGKIIIENLTVGTYTAYVLFIGDSIYKDNQTKVTFNVTKVVIPAEDAFNITTPENATAPEFTIKLPEDATGFLLLDINGTQTFVPLVNGTATARVPEGFAPGNYSAVVTYTGDNKYDPITTTQNITVTSNVPDNAFTIPDTAKDGEPLTYAINLPSDAKGYLEVDVDGTKHVVALVNGSASITVPGLSAGNHNVTVSYTGDGKYSPVTKSMAMNVSAPVYKITNNNNVAAIYSANANYKVLITKDGKAVGAGESVVITFNGKKTTVKTDSKGYATLKLNTKVKVKTYTVTAEYKGVKVSNKVTIKHVIKAKNVNVKKSKKVNKIKVKTNKVNGKFLKGKKLTLKIKGKKIKAKINKKGVATFKVKKSVLKKLKVGKKYKYTVTYGKDTVTKKLKVKR